ncbi:SCO family protein [Peribacillus psychrosaccharolyticus]|uniref:SCO family protein n=1 Tax=Peribacillus psychrosaccharolyticus TaxID=1407 RepID=A0A974NLT3_PERPY|nr:SCO family protein [Peribacillus psychrosaccharolyticus]MEC2056608.1 SCO family protein [Peribacillus psychrosaccharolyticus]MED3745740.1 SCO family protein [Peribacillus psychrosaccharolyticus]QQT00257.1 SCO family protein [Peribacillus psychrosaccharolyticus]
MKKLPMLMILMMTLLVSACGSKEVPNANNWETEDFSFIDQNGKDFSKSDLKGKVWVADFIFTNCTTVCLPMTANLIKLQQQLKDEGIKDVEFVSFSVDPETDKPDVLKNYGTKMNADLSNWHFLTGYSQAEIEKFAFDNFKTLVKKPENETQVIHGTTFYLVDQEGTIIQDYSGTKDVPYEEIIKHIKILQNY